MIEQVKELKPELQPALLTQHRQAPVFVEGKVHIAGVRGKALSRIASRPLAEDISVHGEGVRANVLQVVSAVAGLARYHQWTNAEICETAVANRTPRIAWDGY